MSDFYVYIGYCLGEPFYTGKGVRDRIGAHEKDAKRGGLSGDRRVHRFIRAMEAENIPRVWRKVFTGLSELWALDLEYALIDDLGVYPNGVLLNRQQSNGVFSYEARTFIRRRTRLWRCPP